MKRSELIVEIDEALDEDAAMSADVLLERLQALIAPPAPETPFGRRYLGLLQRSPGVVMAHSAVLSALADGERKDLWT